MSDVLWFRRLLALHQLIYLGSFWPEPGNWFNAGEMIVPDLIQPGFASAVHLFGEMGGPLFWGLAVLGWLWMFVRPEQMPKLAQFVLVIVQVSLHQANPLIIHEPQQLANFFLVVSLMWPRSAKSTALPGMRRAMVAMLAIYYLVAGLKKLPDPLWRNGEALSMLLQWPPFGFSGGPTALGRFLLEHPWFARIGTWFALVFEIGFAFVAWSRFRRWLIPAGVVFHIMIASTIEVGTFGLIMMPWYCFLARRRS